jgi:hypothetical protein
MFCRGIEQNDTPVIRIVGHLHVASDRFPSEWPATYLGISFCFPVIGSEWQIRGNTPARAIFRSMSFDRPLLRPSHVVWQKPVPRSLFPAAPPQRKRTKVF